MQGDHPNPKENPKRKEPIKGRFFLLVLKLLLNPKDIIYLSNMNWMPKIIAKPPPTSLINSLCFITSFPRPPALYPNIINIRERPIKKEKISIAIRGIFFLFPISFKLNPAIKAIYEGINGKIQGVKKVINPAIKAKEKLTLSKFYHSFSV